MVFLLAVAGLWGLSVWLQTPGGTRCLSKWITGYLQAKIPGSRVELEQFQLWLRPEEASPGASALRLPLRWRASGQVSRLDLASLDQALLKGEWKADGILAGPFEVGGSVGRIESVHLQLASQSPGGNVSRDLLDRLLGMMPPGDTRAMLLKAIAAKAFFHYNVGQAELSMKEEVYQLHLVLDGEHLLDITIRVPEESVGFLLDLNPS